MARIGVVVHTALRDVLFSKADLERLAGLGDVVFTESESPLGLEEGLEILKDCEIGLGTWGSPCPSAELLKACPDLKLWVHAAGSVRHMVAAVEASGRDVAVASCTPAIAENVAEFTLGELILGVRRAFENARANREGKAPSPANGLTLTDSVIGVVGASTVGRRLLELLQPFETTALLYDPFCSKEQAEALGAEKVEDLVDLCQRVDALTLHAPMLEATRKMIARRHLEALKDDAVFINCARGGLIDEPALVEELKKGRFTAYLDVTDPEPAALDSPLRSLPNVVLTSHIAGGKNTRIGRQAVDDIARFLVGEKPKMVVTPKMLVHVA